MYKFEKGDNQIKVTDETTKTNFLMRCREEDFKKILNGEQNLVTALMQGRVTIKGDLMLVQRFNKDLRSNIKKGK